MPLLRLALSVRGKPMIDHASAMAMGPLRLAPCGGCTLPRHRRRSPSTCRTDAPGDPAHLVARGSLRMSPGRVIGGYSVCYLFGALPARLRRRRFSHGRPLCGPPVPVDAACRSPAAFDVFGDHARSLAESAGRCRLAARPMQSRRDPTSAAILGTARIIGAVNALLAHVA